MKELKEILKKSFGKEKDSRVHAIVMLCIYAVFMFILVIVIRTNGTVENQEDKNKNISNDEITTQLESNDKDSSNINYTYSYIITYDNQKETYIGSRVNNKEKFTYMKDNDILEYAKVGDNYLIKKDDTFHVTDKLNNYSKYCDIEKLLEILKEYYNQGNETEEKYIVDTSDMAKGFNDKLSSYCGASTNNIDLVLEGENIKEANMNLDNYITCIEGSEHTLNIKMEFTSIGTTPDFEIKMD